MRSVVVECGGRVLLCVGNVREKKQSERGAWGVVFGVVNLPSISGSWIIVIAVRL